MESGVVTKINEVLKACGFDKIQNNRNEIIQLIQTIIQKYDIQFNKQKLLIDFLEMYNGLSVDVSVAIRKSMKQYHFNGGFSISLDKILRYEDKENIDEQRQLSGENVFPVGDGFCDTIYIGESGKIYLTGGELIAENWDTFLVNLIDDKYADL